jgi:hypothetical protein
LANSEKPYVLTGGLRWHLTALMQRKNWSPMRQWVDRLIALKPATGGPLLIMGPSAGWTFSTRALGTFNPVIGVDMDPLAPWLFRTRHVRGGRQIQWIRTDFMADLDSLLASHSGATVLFANTLGQQGFLQDQPALLEQTLSGLQHRLTGRCWASYHDRFSIKLPDAQNARSLQAHLHKQVSKRQHSNPTASALTCADIQTWLDDWTQQSQQPKQKSSHAQLRIEVTDHLTDRVLPANSQRNYCVWAFKPKQIHVVEGAWVQNCVD